MARKGCLALILRWRHKVYAVPCTQCIKRASLPHHLAGIERVGGYLWLLVCAAAKLQTSQQPQAKAHHIQDGCVGEAEGEIHRVMGSAGAIDTHEL